MEPETKKTKPSLILKFGFTCFELLMTFALLFASVDSIQNHAVDSAVIARYPAPVTLTYEEFVRRHPKEGWFRITGGLVDLAAATATNQVIGGVERFGTTVQVEAPLRSIKDVHKEPIYIAVSSKDPNLCKEWSHLHDVQEGLAADGPKADGSDAPSAEAEDARDAARIGYYAAQHPEKLFIPRDVEGIIKTGDYSDMRKTSTSSTPRGMADDYIVLEDGTTGADFSNRTVGKGVVGISLVLLYWIWRIRKMVLTWRKRPAPVVPT